MIRRSIGIVKPSPQPISKAKINLLKASNFCLMSAISASAAASLCWDMASASMAVFTRNSKLCSSREDFKLWTWAHALYSKSLAAKTSLQVQIIVKNIISNHTSTTSNHLQPPQPPYPPPQKKRKKKKKWRTSKILVKCRFLHYIAIKPRKVMKALWVRLQQLQMGRPLWMSQLTPLTSIGGY